MSKFLTLAAASLAVASLTAPGTASAAQIDPVACSVNVVYTLNNVERLSYVKDFVVSLDAPFFDDFSSATRFRSFDAALVDEGGTPVIVIYFDAEVSVFNAVTFGADLKMDDKSKAKTESGQSGFFTSVPGAAGSHITRYTLTCDRAK